MGMDMPPAPPMGPDPMGGEDPMGDPGMGGEDPMAGGDDGMAPPPEGGDDDELTQVIDGLSMEDKAAVLKYAKSMADNNGGDEQAPAPMPNESRMVKTTMKEMMRSVTLPPEDRKTERDEKKLSKKFTKKNPFVSPY